MNVEQLLSNNKQWSKSISEKDPDYFKNLSKTQTPEFLWIGCADSRVPDSQVVGLGPGEIFVHRNVANLVIHTDLNCLSVLQYAVEVLKVQHILVVGHYGCGGVKAALLNASHGLIDNWLRHVQDVKEKHTEVLAKLDGEEAQHDRLCELNVIEQVYNVCQTTVVQGAWKRGQTLTVHGLIYGLKDGLLHDFLNVRVNSPEEMHNNYLAAVAARS